MQTARRLVSEAEFLALPESMERVELLDGEVIASPSPHVRHQEIVRRLLVALSLWARDRDEVFVGLSPQDVRFGPSRILQPDLFVILGTVSLDLKGPIDRVPDLCIEVLSGQRVYDRVTKRLVYAGAGVREYWCVDHDLVERWHGPGLSAVEEVRDHLCSPLLQGFAADVRELLSI